jgi:hypothetical protein
MKRPEQFTTGSTEWAVRWLNELVRLNAPVDAYGVTLEAQREIHIRTDMNPDFEQHVFLHELLHACVSESGLSHEMEETFVGVIAPRLLEVLRDNPGVVRYLLSRR